MESQGKTRAHTFLGVAPTGSSRRSSGGAKAKEPGSVRRARLALSGFLALGLLLAYAQWEAAWGSDTTLVNPGPFDNAEVDMYRIPGFGAPRNLDAGHLGSWLVVGGVTGSPNATFDILYDGVGLDDRFWTVDSGLSFSLLRVLPSARIGSTTSTFVWQQGVTTHLTQVRTSDQGLEEFLRETFDDEVSADLVHGRKGKTMVSVLRDRITDTPTKLAVRKIGRSGEGLEVGERKILVDVGQDEFVNEPSILYLPMWNEHKVLFSRGNTPFDNLIAMYLVSLEEDLEMVGEPTEVFASHQRRRGAKQSQTGSGYWGAAAETSGPGNFIRFAGWGPAHDQARALDVSLAGTEAQGSTDSSSWLASRNTRATARQPETTILGTNSAGFYRLPRLAPAGHDSLIAVGVASEPPSFQPTVKAQLVHGDGTLGGVATFQFPQDLQPVVAVPVMGYRNELLVSLADTSVPITDSGVVRLPLTVTTPPCQADDTTLCLDGGRFKAELAWRDTQGRSGVGHARPLTSDTGTFWIFDANNLEVGVKVLDAQALNDHFWVFAMGLTDLGIGITVTDTETGHFATFYNVLGRAFAPYQNTQALPGDDLTLDAGWMDRFATPFGDVPTPGAAADAMHRPTGTIRAQSSRGSTAACVADATKLCLAGGRFEVSATFETAQGQSGAAQTVGITADSGYLWFFDQDNVEALIKVLDACVINQRIWVFAGGLTDVKVVLTVRDSVTGQVRTYTNPLGTPFQPIQDTGAFATCS